MDKNCPDPEPPGRERLRSGRSAFWERVAETFTAALSRPVPERKAWLAGLEGADDELKREVTSLLDAADRAGDFLTPGTIRISDFDDLPGQEPE